MHRYRSIPLIFLVIGSMLGLFLRWQFLSPTQGVNYSFFLHGHSHIMFLGWLFNVFYIGFVDNYIAKRDEKFFRILFICLQALVVAMLISFPLQGYGSYSILFSTLHTLLAVVFIITFLIRTKTQNSTSIWYARAGLIFFIISTAGPFSLGYLMANGLGQTNWYYFSVYFYLHFQYNGFFLLAAMSLLFSLLEKRNVKFKTVLAKNAGKILAAVCIPAYSLSILWAGPGLLYNVVGLLSALLQLVALVPLTLMITKSWKQISNTISKTSKLCLSVVSLALLLKLLLQFLSGFPFIAQITMELRPVVIAYLHLVLLAVITLPVLVWYKESGFISGKYVSAGITVFLISFTGMELGLVLMPWWSNIVSVVRLASAHYIFVFSAGLTVSCILLCVASFKKADKSQYSG